MDKYERLAKIVDPIIAGIPADADLRKEYVQSVQDDIFKAMAVMNEFEVATDPAEQEVQDTAVNGVFRSGNTLVLAAEPVDGYGPLGSFIVSEKARALPEAVVVLSTVRAMISTYRLTLETDRNKAVFDEFAEKFQDLILKS